MRIVNTIVLILSFISTTICAQEKVYIYKDGAIVNEYTITDVDSIIFYKPIIGPSVTDYEGNIYKIVVIGNQTWMAENLRTTKLNDGTAIPNITENSLWANATSSAYCWYDNNSTYKNPNGALYNWYTVETNKLCPSGWHVPSTSDWDILENKIIADGYSVSEAGNTLKSTTGWFQNGSGQDVFGFNAIPSGNRNQFGYVELSSGALFWTSSYYDTNNSHFRSLYFMFNELNKGNILKKEGASVRCIKN